MNQEYDIHQKNKAALNSALISAISETKDVHADSTNPFHKNKYASLSAHLAAIKPIFAKHGLAIVQMAESDSVSIGVTTMVIHKDGGSMQTYVGIPSSHGMKGQDAGAIISYLRRYALASVAGVATEDDDAEVDRISKTASTGKYIANPNASAHTQSSQTGSSQPTQNSSNDDPIVPFGKMKGSKLSELDDYNLDYWANKWEPKPWEKTGKVGPKDLALKAAAVKLWNERKSGSVPDVEIPEFNEEDVPF